VTGNNGLNGEMSIVFSEEAHGGDLGSRRVG